ncbi:hypothetical protein B0H11DRAFT_2257148 [Mycena galericulata]|nr:hypothetical protein B0H11DRAFT_2257148 [Mycena galericulata]
MMPVPSKSHAQTSPETADSDSEPDHPADTKFPRRMLSREDRALCRRLAHNNIPAKIVAHHFKCSIKTIRKIGKNDYSPKDDLSEDSAKLPGDWKATLAKLTNDHAAATKPTNPPGKDSKRAERPHHKPAIDTKSRSNDAPAASRDDAIDTRLIVAARGTKPHTAQSFLEKFVLGIPLDLAWADILRKSGFTEEKLRRMAAAPQARVMQFIRESLLFKDMLEIDQFTLALAIGRLAIPASP